MMGQHSAWCAASLLAGALVFSPCRAAEAPAKIGDRVEKLTFKDIHYLPRTLDDFVNKKAFVLVFTNTTCPVAQRYFPTLKALDKEFRGRDVQFMAVNVGAEDSIVMMAAQAIQYGVEIPFVKDFDGHAAQALGVQRTPEVVVLDAKRTMRYRGRIDDQYRLGGTRATAEHHDLKDALTAVLAGSEVKTPETPIDGCLITFPTPATPNAAITYSEHIAPLLRQHCVECHRPNTTAPFSLLTYKQAASKAAEIAEVVAEQRMPPWFASPAHGTFINKRSLTAAEREQVAAWAHAGAPEGDPAKAPRAKLEFPNDGQWLIGKPDLVVSTREEDLPAAGDIAYKYAVLPYIFLEDTWVQGVQIKPSNRRSVHHCNMAYVTPSEKFKRDNFITGYVPGGNPMLLGDGVAFRIPKGSLLALQIHFVTTGKEEKCRLDVGFKYATGTIQKRLRFMLLEDTKFAIPPGAPAYPVTVTHALDADSVGLGLFSHMHLRGKDMIFKAHYPDGKDETLLVIPNYSFDWQIAYVWEAGKKRFPKGTKIECIAHYDNSPFNPFNPNPKATVREGPQTYHEMMNGFMFFTHADEQLNLDVNPKSGRAIAGQASR